MFNFLAEFWGFAVEIITRRLTPCTLSSFTSYGLEQACDSPITTIAPAGSLSYPSILTGAQPFFVNVRILNCKSTTRQTIMADLRVVSPRSVCTCRQLQYHTVRIRKKFEFYNMVALALRIYILHRDCRNYGCW